MRDTVYVCFDIETVANDCAKTYYAKKSYDAPANYKDPEKIANAIREKRQADMERAPLHWWTGKVVCVSASVINADVPPRNFLGKDERNLLIDFFDWLWWLEDRYEPRNAPILTGKSTDTFDLPFLVGRALAHDIGILAALRPRFPISDIDKVFSSSSQCDQRSTLANYAWGLDLAPKTGKGTDVATLWHEILQGDTTARDRLAAYCAHDNAIAAELLARWLKPYTPTAPGLASAPITPNAIDEIPFG